MQNKFAKALAMCLAITLATLVYPAPNTANSCEVTGYTIGFFNGVWNTQKQADASLAISRAMRMSTFNSQPVSYEVFYNYSNCASSTKSCLQDLAETFEQRAREIDASGQLGQRWEIFWESLAADKPISRKSR